jgi:hypothetical protein
MSDIADKIYAATGLVLNAETTAAMERFIKQEKHDAMLEMADLCDEFWEHSPGICAIAIRELVEVEKTHD